MPVTQFHTQNRPKQIFQTCISTAPAHSLVRSLRDTFKRRSRRQGERAVSGDAMFTRLDGRRTGNIFTATPAIDHGHRTRAVVGPWRPLWPSDESACSKTDQKETPRRNGVSRGHPHDCRGRDFLRNQVAVKWPWQLNISDRLKKDWKIRAILTTQQEAATILSKMAKRKRADDIW